MVVFVVAISTMHGSFSRAARWSDGVRRLATVWQRIVRWRRRLLRDYRVRLVVLAGSERHSGESIVLVTSASGPERVYLAELIFGDNYVERDGRSVWLWGLRKAALQTGADLLVHFSRKGSVPTGLRRRGVFRIPVWIHGDVDFDTVDRLRSDSKNIKRDFDRIRRNALSYQVTEERAQFDEFYHSMHVPYVRSVHGSAAHVLGYTEFANRFDDSELLWIKQGSTSVAGQMLVYDKGLPRLWMLGMKDGSPDYVKLGALTACYIFSMQYLGEKGFKRMRVGSSKAFLKDGVLQYKRKWGVEIAGAKESLFLLDVLKLNSATKAFLANNPFCQLRDGELMAEIFSDENESLSEAKLFEINKLFYFSGMSHLHIHKFALSEAGGVGIPEELSHITVFDATMTFDEVQ